VSAIERSSVFEGWGAFPTTIIWPKVDLWQLESVTVRVASQVGKNEYACRTGLLLATERSPRFQENVKGAEPDPAAKPFLLRRLEWAVLVD
jgi:hypothetical protein